MKQEFNNRCGVCDFIPNGMCHNYEIDRYTLSGHLNKVEWRSSKQAFVCTKCHEAIIPDYWDIAEVPVVSLTETPMIEYHPQQKELEPA